MTKQDYEFIKIKLEKVSDISSQNLEDTILAFSILEQFRSDNNYLYYGLILTSKFSNFHWNDVVIASIHKIHKKIFEGVARKVKGYPTVAKLAIQNWLYSPYCTDKQAINQLGKIFKQLKLEHDNWYEYETDL